MKKNEKKIFAVILVGLFGLLVILPIIRFCLPPYDESEMVTISGRISYFEQTEELGHNQRKDDIVLIRLESYIGEFAIRADEYDAFDLGYLSKIKNGETISLRVYENALARIKQPGVFEDLIKERKRISIYGLNWKNKELIKDYQQVYLDNRKRDVIGGLIFYFLLLVYFRHVYKKEKRKTNYNNK